MKPFFASLLAVIVLSACAGGAGSIPPPGTPPIRGNSTINGSPTAQTVYMLQLPLYTPYLVGYAANSTGNVPPSTALTDAIGNKAQTALALDAAGNIYIGYSNGSGSTMEIAAQFSAIAPCSRSISLLSA